MLFTGSLLIEVIFSLDGLGLLGFEAAISRDYPVMFGTLYFFSADRPGDEARRRPHLHPGRSAHRLRGARLMTPASTPPPRCAQFRANRRGYWSRCGCSACCSSSRCSPSSSPTTGRSWSATTALSTCPVLRDYPETDLRRRLADRRRSTRDAEVAAADRGQGLDAVAADPLQLRHDRLDLARPRALAARRAQHLARHRRPGARRAGAA